MSGSAESWIVTLVAVVILNFALGMWGRQWWRQSAIRARQLSGSGTVGPAGTIALDSPRATLVVERAGGYIRDGGRLYAVVVDGHRVGKVAPGASFAADVAAGTHTVQLRIDGFGSRRLQVTCEAGSEVWLSCRAGDPSPLVIDDLVLGFLGKRPWILLEAGPPDPS